ncbi:MAG: GDP-mannose 4,6-dehydratase [Candidatus Obscuribacterales bacterium]|nr:GDP-mannose 4,6-dehydratase [Candidatus Obscuribacterales bacterium]
MILVTGGAGYIGSHFVNYISQKEADEEILVLDKVLPQFVLKALSPRIKWVEGDICDQSLLRKLFSQYKITEVVHFAAYLSVPESQALPHLYFKNNVAGSMALFEVMEEFGIRRIQLRHLRTAAGQTSDRRGSAGSIERLRAYETNG